MCNVMLEKYFKKKNREKKRGVGLTRAIVSRFGVQKKPYLKYQNEKEVLKHYL